MSREDILLNSLIKFYEDPKNENVLHSILSKEEGAPSLRSLEWFITKFSKGKEIRYKTKQGKEFTVHMGYKSTLGGYSKRLFDPFCRTKRIEFHGHQTTVGQLNYIKWCIQNDIIEAMQREVPQSRRELREHSMHETTQPS